MYVGTLFKVDISKKYDGKITRLFNTDKNYIGYRPNLTLDNPTLTTMINHF